MARTRALLIFATCITSGIALILSAVALGTNQWVTGTVDLSTTGTGTTVSEITYGLFSGIYTRTLISTFDYTLFATCDFGQNKCAMLCGDSNLRFEYLQLLLDGDTNDGYRACLPRSLRITNESSVVGQTRADEPTGFINGGAWITTIIFLVLSCMTGIISTVLALWNTVSNPVESFFNIFGVIIYNSVACLFTFIVIIVWGVQFATTLAENIGIYDTIIQLGNSDGLSSLGYSYWLNLVSLILYGTSIAILLVRKYLIDKEPQNIITLDDNKNDTIILF